MATIVGVVGCGKSQNDPASVRVDRLFAQWNNAQSPGCSVGISRNGTVLYEHGYGMADLEWGVPITPSTVMGAASISKQFTAMSILLLAQQGKLTIDDDVSIYVPDWADREHHVTIRNLLNHTSGLREGFFLLGMANQNPYADQNEAMVHMLARQREVNFAAGEQFQYNNGGYNLLGSIVKRVSGHTLRDFEEANIFKPLGMTNTQIRDSMGLLIPHRAAGYTQDASGVRASSEAVGVVGNAGLYTTPDDLLRWEHNFDDVRVGTREIIAAMQKPAVFNNGKTSEYGFGLFIDNYRGLRTVEHSGGDRGISTNLVRFPDQKLAIALMCNSDAINPIILTHKIADIYLEDVAAPADTDSAPATRATVPERDLVAWTGSYHSSTNRVLSDLQVSLRDGKVIAHSFYIDDVDVTLTPTDARHALYPGGTVFEFHPAAAGHSPAWQVTWKDGRPQEVLDMVEFKPEATDLPAFAGQYRSEDIKADYGIVVQDSALVVQAQGMADVPLKAFARDTFVGMGVVKFLRDAHGAVAGFTMDTYSLRNLRFNRVRRAD